MHTPADWKNVLAFLEGLKIARRTVTGTMMQKLVRKANERGRQGTVMDLLRNVERTGVVLEKGEVVREIMAGAVMKAQAAGWNDQVAVEKALKYAEGILELCEDPRHTRGRMITALDPRARPEVFGTVVLLASVNAKRFHGGKDGDGKVRRYAAKMMALWRNADLKLDGEDWSAANHILFTWSPVWQGMRMALDCLDGGSDIAKQMKRTMTQDLEPVLEQAKSLLAANVPDGQRRRGLDMYESLSAEFGS